MIKKRAIYQRLLIDVSNNFYRSLAMINIKNTRSNDIK